MFRFLIYLSGIGRCPSTKFYGLSGKAYPFIYREEHRALCFEGRDMSAQEFQALAPDIFGATGEQNTCQAVPKLLPGHENEVGGPPQMPTLADATKQQKDLTRLCAQLGAKEIEVATLRTMLTEARAELAAVRDLSPLQMRPVEKPKAPEAEKAPEPKPAAKPPKPAAAVVTGKPEKPAPDVADGFYDPDA